MLDVLYRMGLRGKATVHGFRGLASTVLNESGLFDGNWIEYQLAHHPGGMDRRHNPAQFLRPRRFMMQGWADYLETAETGMRSEEHTSELQSLMRISYAVFCLKKKKQKTDNPKQA